MLHGMARSKKNGVAPSKDKKPGRKSTGGTIVVVEAGGGNGSAGKSGKKGSSTAKKKKSRVKTKKGQAIDGAEGDEGSMGAASRNTRDALREEVMTQVCLGFSVPSLVLTFFPWLS